MQDLNIALVQSTLYWEDVDANLAMFEEKLWGIDGQQDLIVLPEMFTTGFSMNAKSLAEPMNFKTFKWMKQMAKQCNCMIMGSYIVKSDSLFYNRLLAVNGDGEFFVYDKRHPFRLAGEHHTYSPGKERLAFNLKGWKICPLICYDLRFPVWSRNCYDGEGLQYDVLIYVANWPAPRVNAWDSLLSARAIENLSYCIGVNRVGEDEAGHNYLGHSSCYDYMGHLKWTNEGEEVIETVSLNYEEMREYREKFAFYLDADRFTMEDNLP